LSRQSGYVLFGYLQQSGKMLKYIILYNNERAECIAIFKEIKFVTKKSMEAELKKGKKK